jgi:hypothetical protein
MDKNDKKFILNYLKEAKNSISEAISVTKKNKISFTKLFIQNARRYLDIINKIDFDEKENKDEGDE